MVKGKLLEFGKSLAQGFPVSTSRWFVGSSIKKKHVEAQTEAGNITAVIVCYTNRTLRLLRQVSISRLKNESYERWHLVFIPLKMD